MFVHTFALSPIINFEQFAPLLINYSRLIEHYEILRQDFFAQSNASYISPTNYKFVS